MAMRPGILVTGTRHSEHSGVPSTAVSSPHFAPPGGQRGAYAGSRARQTPPAPSWTPRPPPPVGSCLAPYTLTAAPGALFSLFRARVT